MIAETHLSTLIVTVMKRNQQKVSVGNSVLCWLAILNVIVLHEGYVSHPGWYQLAWVTVPLLIASLFFRRRRVKKNEPASPARPFHKKRNQKTLLPHKPGIVRSIVKKAG